MARLRFQPLGASGDYPSWLRDLSGRSGAYVIRSIGSRTVLYVGESHKGKLRETVTRHFQAWDGPTAGPTYDRARVEVAIRVCPPTSAVAAQDKLICTLEPRDNRTNPCEEVPF